MKGNRFMQRLHGLSMRIFLCVCAALLASAVLAGTASAHSHLQSSDPADGAVLSSAPATVSAVFTEETSLTDTKFDVYYAASSDAAQTVVASGKVDVNDRTKVSATLPAGSGNGVYTVKWHTLTEDDNGSEDGSFSFTVGSGQPATSGTGSTTATTNTLPKTGNADSMLPLLGLFGLVLVSGGLALRRRL